MNNQMVHTLLLKKSPQSQWKCQNQLVQNDKMVFMMPIQIKYLFTRFAIKETKFSNNVHMMSWKWLFIG
jgi:hypothetical protein